MPLTMNELKASVKPAEIDPSGVFKYIVITITSKQENCLPYNIVRGYLDCPYHADILAKFIQNELTEEF